MAGIGWQDLGAFGFFVLAWTLYAQLADHERAGRNLARATHRHRLRWMRRMLDRDNRIFDSNLVGNLMRSVAFFASTTLIIIGGVVAMLGSADRVVAVVSQLPFVAHVSQELWELKILLLATIFIYAFFKFTWSLRQFNYCSILMGAAPPPAAFADAAARERSAVCLAALNSLAGDHFNRGLRAYYFGLAALTWFIHPGLLVVLTGWVVLVLYRREFRSPALDVLEAEAGGGDEPPS
ncbi:putative membrane protein [Plasticicumulans lactativorans]|uniref:Putative membrane protein n=1 Tax=Plasticicumulans lactativorans TaxID=1133106 RepID=A0A4R2L545_9GAMM|nr:DUF599 domain-containing protein [Plasticicumulans lactativorans]TCO82431.1 putative membrane protein [Plasticicumulans lactativorans]